MALDTEDFLGRFSRVYNNLPLEEREMTIVVINDQPISWTMAHRGLQQGTALGLEIGKKLVSLGII